MGAVKNVIYIDIEDDIAGIIGKIKDVSADEVRLVPPKRSTVFSSVVNLKLMNKAAEDADKKLVIVTSEQAIISLAAGLKLPIAASTEAAAAVPSVDEDSELPSEVIDELDSSEVAKEDNAAESAAKDDAKAEETPTKKGLKAAMLAPLLKLRGGAKKSKVTRVPDFARFRKKTTLILGAIGLLTFGVFALNYYVPEAKVVLTAQTRRLPADFEFVVDATSTEPNFEKNTIPAQSQELTKTVKKEFKATGEKDVGKKATGTITVTNCQGPEVTIKKGTTFSADGFTFVALQNTSVPPSSPGPGFSCNEDGKADVPVQAEKSGDQYNLSPRSYSIEGDPEGLSAYGDQMSGGTSEIVAIVAQEDIDTAKEELLESDETVVQTEFEGQQEEGMLTLKGSFTQVVNKVIVNPKQGQEAEQATISIELTYFQFAVSHENLGKLIEANLGESIGENEFLYDDGVKSAIVSLVKKESNSLQRFRLRTDTHIGIELDTEALTRELSDKGYSEAKRIAEGTEGIHKANIELSPFWVFSMPTRPERIEIQLEIIQ